MASLWWHQAYAKILKHKFCKFRSHAVDTWNAPHGVKAPITSTSNLLKSDISYFISSSLPTTCWNIFQLYKYISKFLLPKLASNRNSESSICNKRIKSVRQFVMQLVFLVMMFEILTKFLPFFFSNGLP